MYFVTGVGTDIGKTVATTVLAQQEKRAGNRVTVIKPFQTGQTATGRYPDIAWYEDYLNIRHEEMVVVEPAVSPHIALERAGRAVTKAAIVPKIEAIASPYDVAFVEGAGGLAVPLCKNGTHYFMTEQLIEALGASVYLVVETRLGSIHDALVTIDYAVCRNLPIQGIVFNRYDANDPMERDNVETVMTLSPVKRFATIPSFTTSKEMLDYELRWEEWT